MKNKPIICNRHGTAAENQIKKKHQDLKGLAIKQMKSIAGEAEATN